MKNQQAIDMISSLIFAVRWAERRKAEGGSGAKASAMVKKQAGHLFAAMTGKEPTQAELKSMAKANEDKESTDAIPT